MTFWLEGEDSDFLNYADNSRRRLYSYARLIKQQWICPQNYNFLRTSLFTEAILASDKSGKIKIKTYRKVQLDFTSETEVFYMLFD